MSRSKPLAACKGAGPEPHCGSSRTSQKKNRRTRKQHGESDTEVDDTTDSSRHSGEQFSETPPALAPHLAFSSVDPTSMPLFGGTKNFPVFVASLGNPKPYANTLHSAGHIVLTAIAHQQNYRPWRPFAGGQLAENSERSFSFLRGYSNDGLAMPTLWQCGALMNASGPAVKKAFKKWMSETGVKEGEGRLVIVHDELERELGAVNVRTDHKASARGHNGLKSLMATMPGQKFVRIGVGIGRPASRERDAVSDYVLRQVTLNEVKAFEQAAREVEREINEVREGAIG